MKNASAAVESLRDEHLRVRQDLEHAQIMADVLPEARQSKQRKGMQMIGAILDDSLRAHAAWEERVLAPLVGAESRPAEETLARRIRELIREGGARLPDVRAFNTRLERVIGILIAHLDQERHALRRLAQ